MLIVRLSPGLANQMYEYAAGYALARELNQELVLDIAECFNSAWGYLLDYFNIPDVRKIIYYQVDAEHIGHNDIDGIPVQLREEVDIYIEEADGRPCALYENIEQASEMPKKKNIYLCGYFFNRRRYYKAYWDDIRAQFSLRKQLREIKAFKAFIANKVSIGIHIRRGDFLVAEWAIKPEDDYYKAAIQWFRCRYPVCSFFIFTDDIEYAKELLGKDSSIFYVHFLGYDDISLTEFMCLSLCQHRILSNSSTYGRLADELNWGKERYVIWKGSNTTDKEKNPKQNNRNILLSMEDIRYYSGQYKIDNKLNLENSDKMLEWICSTEVTESNYTAILDGICYLSLNAITFTDAQGKVLLYKKFCAKVMEKDYHFALQDSFRIYHLYRESPVFSNRLLQCLTEIGAREEAIVEFARMKMAKIEIDETNDGLYDTNLMKMFQSMKKKNFLIVPFTKMIASSKIYGLIELGLVLYHLGHDVTFVFDTDDQGEEYYIHKYPNLTNRFGNDLGCRQYLKKDIKKYGIEKFLHKFSKEQNCILISRDKDFYIDGSISRNRVYTVFVDFTDSLDAESRAAKLKEEELKYMYSMADLVLSKNKGLEAALKKYTVIWDDNRKHEAYWFMKERWEIGREHRLNVRNIYLAAALIDKLQDDFKRGKHK